ncbi:MAG: sigma factor [Myxococcales bacterium]
MTELKLHEASSEAGRAAERAARESYGRLLALLAARTRDVAGAEDALGDAFAAALRAWPVDGVPENPDAWLLTAARRRQGDALRRARTRDDGAEQAAGVAEEALTAAEEQDAIPDRRLALMFACAHPAIDPGARSPLVLQCILGLTAEQIAAAFLLPARTMGQRLVRAKLRLRDAGIPFRVPDPEELPARLAAVLDSIYAAYTRDWDATGEDAPGALADEALWLGQLVISLLPDEPEAKGMLALMLYTAARRPARRDETGAYVPLEEQDTHRWDAALLARAEDLLRQASAGGPTGRYQLEAAIQSAHVSRRLTGVADWPAIVALYDHLLALTGSPVVALNRAVARAEVAGPHAALADLAPLGADRRMASYQPYWAARGHLLARAGAAAEAAEALTVAIGLTTDDAIRRHLLTQRSSLAASQKQP